jgi:hypothetical protein
MLGLPTLQKSSVQPRDAVPEEKMLDRHRNVIRISASKPPGHLVTKEGERQPRFYLVGCIHDDFNNVRILSDVSLDLLVTQR